MAIVHNPSREGDALKALLVSAAVVLFALLTLYLVGFDQGAISRSGMFMHELMHDGRHLLGVPCH
ncbi:CbtB domain-containing protein [Nocardia huaxiensis]|uniref:CbtB-domain containing protein n=1 Tax=Nocardia huaxiensis TaxID=2755382 RepID=A0A7D6VA35_9NOCA|nr:CbtB domain-containing protein [Nocardia huaxiensis]QLY31441.1 CbtB-domain containing protein [Nocardia huaxiensis]UFS94990.1 CbtB-domain containing protein [Nocardia huaxiensis]